jgi:hypothetical protein
MTLAQPTVSPSAREGVARESGGAVTMASPTLIRARVIPGLPVDPMGTPYELTPAGRVGLSPPSPLLPLPNEPVKAVGTVS